MLRSTALEQAIMRGALLHDLGKANHHFQRMVTRESDQPQAFRHELISAWLLLKHPSLAAWLFDGCSEEVRICALVAVLGHHLKFRDGTNIEVAGNTGDTVLEIFTDHPDFQTTLNVGASLLDLGAPPRLEQAEIDLLSDPLTELLQWLPSAVNWFQNASKEGLRFAALVRGLVIAADVAGSAVPRRGIDPAEWTDEVLRRVCSDHDLQEIARTRLGESSPRAFQTEVMQSEARVTFVRAGCGSGKTVAAYFWAATHAAGRKVFFCYPTTGTSTEGFRDYIVPSEMRADAELLHSRSELDLEGMQFTREDDLYESMARFESLRSWDVPLVLCTTDVVLGVMQNHRRGLFSLPSFLNAAFVFDEIHQYDDRLFASLLHFMNTFQRTPILLMTASLPQARLEALRMTIGNDLAIVSGPVEFEQIKRYVIERADTQVPWDDVERALANGKKILWVANTVDRAVSFALEARRRSLPVLPYHSRYRYGDRINKHNAIIEAFRASLPVIAVTTQVCEVSLDLSADLLVTDLAPVPSLIQRLGRLNRRVHPEHILPPCRAIILPVDSALPYEQHDLVAAQKWLSSLGNEALSQADLAAAFEEVSDDDVCTWEQIPSQWIDGGVFSTSAPLREAGATIPVLREEDRPACVDDHGRPIVKEITRNTIPMPLSRVIRNEIDSWEKLSFVFVAPGGRIDYSVEWGGKWARK
jgi:CRISPR-associated endonuclease/helicase Cas3